MNSYFDSLTIPLTFMTFFLAICSIKGIFWRREIPPFWSVTVRDDIEGGTFDPTVVIVLQTSRKNDANVEMSQGAVKMMLMSGGNIETFHWFHLLESGGWGGGVVTLERTKGGENCQLVNRWEENVWRKQQSNSLGDKIKENLFQGVKNIKMYLQTIYILFSISIYLFKI